MSSELVEGFKVMFKMSEKFEVTLYMTKEYYEQWKYSRDSSIRNVQMERVMLNEKMYLS